MVFKNYIEFFTDYLHTINFHVKILLFLLSCLIIILLFNFIFDIINFFRAKYTVKIKLLAQEKKLISLKKKYQDGKINANEYKLTANKILNN
tara:strand:+ start:148 stop:423 length:276 start_codon:yes stop_codon:yes gene_type:complete